MAQNTCHDADGSGLVLSAATGAQPFSATPPLVHLFGLFQEFSPDPEANIQAIVHKALEFFDGTSCCYCRFCGEETVLRAWRGKFGIPAPHSPKPLNASLCYSALKDCGEEPLAVEDLHEPAFKGARAGLKHIGCASFLGVPITVKGETLGALCLFDTRKRTYSPGEIQTFALLAKTLSMEEARLQKEAEINECRRTIRQLQAKEKELARQNAKLEEMNKALSVLVNSQKDAVGRIETQVAHNIREIMDPSIRRLKYSDLNADQRKWMDLLEANLNEIASPLVSRLSSGYLKLTPTEIKIAAFIKYGKTNKEISELLGISIRTVEVHRCNIRKRLGIKQRGLNLRTYLLSIEGG